MLLIFIVVGVPLTWVIHRLNQLYIKQAIQDRKIKILEEYGKEPKTKKTKS